MAGLYKNSILGILACLATFSLPLTAANEHLDFQSDHFQLSLADHLYQAKNTGIYSVSSKDPSPKTDLYEIQPLPAADLISGTVALMGSTAVGINDIPLSLSSDEKAEMNDLITKHYDCCGSCCVDCCCVEMEENDLYAAGGGGGGYGGGGGVGYGGGVGFSGGGGIGGVGTGTGTDTTSTTTSSTTGTTTTGTSTGTTSTGVVVPEPGTWLIMAGMVAMAIYLKTRRDHIKE